MKQRIFTLLMMLALVFVAGSAMAQTNQTPYQGGVYTYSVSNIVVQTAGTGTIEYLDASNAPLAGATISAVSGFGGSAPNYTVATGGINLGFTVTWANNVAPGKLRVTVIDGATTGGCTNFIEMTITPVPLPTFAISITPATAICQQTATAPANLTAASSGQTTNYDVTVTPVWTNVLGAYTYTYTLDLSTALLTATYSVTKVSGDGTSTPIGTGSFTVTGSIASAVQPTPDVYRISFPTTTGIAPVVIPGTVTSASMTVTAAAKTYTAADDTEAITIRTMPSIGTFN